jgi:hypothetical protein
MKDITWIHEEDRDWSKLWTTSIVLGQPKPVQFNLFLYYFGPNTDLNNHMWQLIVETDQQEAWEEIEYYCPLPFVNIFEQVNLDSNSSEPDFNLAVNAFRMMLLELANRALDMSKELE